MVYVYTKGSSLFIRDSFTQKREWWGRSCVRRTSRRKGMASVRRPSREGVSNGCRVVWGLVSKSDVNSTDDEKRYRD